MSDTFYNLFLQEEWLVPATADYTGLPITVVQKAWDKAKKAGKLCVIKVPGDLPANKRCGVCETLARREALTCKTCGNEYSVYSVVEPGETNG